MLLDCNGSYQNDDNSAPLVLNSPDQPRQIQELWVQDKVQLALHVVNVSILHILQHMQFKCLQNYRAISMTIIYWLVRKCSLISNCCVCFSQTVWGVVCRCVSACACVCAFATVADEGILGLCLSSEQSCYSELPAGWDLLNLSRIT